jgi:glycosyltransferase involved in cell wall biosynthesis
MDVSLILCTRNRAAQVAAALESLRALDFEGEWELIVVDNGSTDDTPRELARFQAAFPRKMTIAGEARLGLANARNCGWPLAQAAIVAFLDDDCYPVADWLTAIATCFAEDSRLGFVGGRVLLYDPTDQPITIQEQAFRQEFEPGDFIPPGLIQGANFAFRLEAIETAGGFDGRLGPGTRFSCEDVEMLARVSAAGWRGAYDPRPVVRHHHGRKTKAEVARLMREYDRGRGAYYARCLANPRLRWKYLRVWCGKLVRQSGRRSLRELAAAAEFWWRG